MKKIILLLGLVLLVSLATSCKTPTPEEIVTGIHQIDPTTSEADIIAMNIHDMKQPTDKTIRLANTFFYNVQSQATKRTDITTIDYPIIRYYLYDHEADNIQVWVYDVVKQQDIEVGTRFVSILPGEVDGHPYYEITDRVDGLPGSIYLLKENPNY